MNTLFTEADVIDIYTRAQAIEDGVLVEVSEIAREAGFKWPVAITAGLWVLINDIPPNLQGIQDIEGRLWDVVWMANWAVRRGEGTETFYTLRMDHNANGRRYKNVRLKLVSGPGDDFEPVITIMLPNED